MANSRPQRREFDRNDRDAPRRDRKDRPPRFETKTPEAGGDEKPARPPRPHRNEVQKKIWRADDVQERMTTRSTPKAPRRGFDPKQARAENAERTHQRAGRIKSAKGAAYQTLDLSDLSFARLAKNQPVLEKCVI